MTKERNNYNKAKLVKWMLGLFLAFSLLVSAGLLFFAHQLEPLLSNRIKETIETSTDSLYQISFSDISVNPITGNVNVENILFKVNYRVYQKLKRKGVNPTHIYNISVKSLSLKRVHPLKVYFHRDLDINAVVVNNPFVRVYYQHPGDENKQVEDRRTPWQRLSKYLNSIRIRDISLNNINFRYTDQSLRKQEIDGVKNLSIRITDLLIDSVSGNDPSRFYFTKDIFVQVKNHEYLTRNQKYKVLFEEMNISSSRKSALVKGLQIIPRFREMQYFPDEKAARLRYHAKLGLLKLDDINIQRLTDRRELRASSLTVANAEFQIFLNRLIPKDEFDRGINFPHLALKRFRLNIGIDSVKVLNTSVNYREYNPETERSGRFFMSEINGKILNLTNDSNLLQKNRWVRSQFHSLLYGKAKLKLNMDFNLLSPDAEFNYSGHISDLNARYFNALTRPLALMRINSGQISDAHFSAKADYRTVKGQLEMRYNDLNIGILRVAKNKTLQKHLLLSLVANNLLLKEDNPLKGETVRKANIHFSRPDSVAFIGMLWKSLYTGIKETIGFTSGRQQEIKAQFDGFRADSDRTARKEARRTKRSDRRSREETSLR